MRIWTFGAMQYAQFGVGRRNYAPSLHVTRYAHQNRHHHFNHIHRQISAATSASAASALALPSLTTRLAPTLTSKSSRTLAECTSAKFSQSVDKLLSKQSELSQLQQIALN